MASKLSPFSLISLLFLSFPFSSTLKKKKGGQQQYYEGHKIHVLLLRKDLTHQNFAGREAQTSISTVKWTRGNQAFWLTLMWLRETLYNFRLVIFWKSLSSPWELIPSIIVHCLQASFCYPFLLTEQTLISSFHLLKVLLKATSSELVYSKCCPCH